MNIAIVEDELLAAEKLEKMIAKYNNNYHVVARLDSVEEAVAWLKSHDAPDLMFLDIQLTDGTSFDIFHKVTVQCPVIFTTAYDQYALEAFQLHSIDYLIKPISQEKLSGALDKLKDLKSSLNDNSDIYMLLREIGQNQNTYKNRFLVKSGSTLRSIETNDIAYFFSEDKLVFLMTASGSRFVLGETLDELEKQLNPADFFRINRQYIISFSSIHKVHQHFKGRLKIEFSPLPDEEVFISNRRASAFKEWMDQ
jgi:DNA-binding LytR/AlgR family response regulator